MLLSIAPSSEVIDRIREEARLVFQDARQESVRYKAWGNRESRLNAINALNHLYLLYLEVDFQPKEIGTTHTEVTEVYHSLGARFISNSLCAFFHVHVIR